LEQNICAMLREKCVLPPKKKMNEDVSPLKKKKWGVHRRRVRPQYNRTLRKVLILDCSSVNDLDVTAISALKRISIFSAKLNTTIAFANWKGPQRDFLHQANFFEIVPPRRCFLSIHDAVVWAQASQKKHITSLLPRVPDIPQSLSHRSSIRQDGTVSLTGSQDRNINVESCKNSPHGTADNNNGSNISGSSICRDNGQQTLNGRLFSPEVNRHRSAESLPHVSIHLPQTTEDKDHNSVPLSVPNIETDTPCILRYYGEVGGGLRVPGINRTGDTPQANQQNVVYEVGRDGSTRAWGRANPSQNQTEYNFDSNAFGDSS